MQTATEKTVVVGTRIRCNDPRYGWTVTVAAIRWSTKDGATAYFKKPEPITGEPTGRWIGVKFTRIYTDGKTRHQGYNTVATA